MRIGTGYDVHPLVTGRKLVLGGVEIPFDKGLDGWSDADVLVHAICDALLGAAALGDIGRHFPPGDPAYRGVSSLVLLARTGEMLAEKGYHVVNIDSTIIAERPRLAGYIDAMRGKLAGALGIDIGRVSVKASTNNGVGAIARGEGIAAMAVVLVEDRENSKI
jgi:2-C-methyl-D-erythritol 2,4-cyclodiphosphate synthase